MKNLTGNTVLVGYAIFIISTIFLALFSIPSQGISMSLHEVLDGFPLFAFWAILIAGLVPTFLKHKYASVAYALPLVFLIIASWTAYSEFSNAASLGRAFGAESFINEMLRSIRIREGFYLSVISAILLAIVATSRTLKAVAAAR